MRILLVSNMYPSQSSPSYGVFVKNTEKILIGIGHDVDKVVLYRNNNKLFKAINYMRYYFLILYKGLFSEYDAIYVHYASHNAPVLLLLKLIKNDIKIYLNVHGSDIVPENNRQERLQIFVRNLLKKCYKIIAPSNYFKNLIINKYKLEHKTIEIFPSGGVNPRTFNFIDDRQSLYKEFDLDKDYNYIGYVGRIDYNKGWNIFLESLFLLKQEGLLNDKKAIIVGNGKELEDFKTKLKGYSLEEDIIHFDLLPQDKLNKIFNIIDVLCFPTMREGESLGLVGLEAMACGTPVIGSEMAGLLDYLNHNENGLFFEPGNSKDLKERIKEYYSFPTQIRNNMKKSAISMAEKYSIDGINIKLKNIFIDK
ncbi:hypothetical protein BC6307_21375 [Sutcliffiella cohnii]|uniref:Glycosyl transferase family 1 n=1 Tax=Sutcliffiella cohnii TaxID=33932 RepID=A0A223KVY7_9BACI|nr:glycosyltransferase family 4 protein [Sutcliffiella cohnii]AST93632.1 hypothetical protein BC6307_21375 [Sutcliffiella cohnii]